MYRESYLYPRLPPIANHVIVVDLRRESAVYAFRHFYWEFEEIAIYRQGSYTREDFIVRPADVPAGDGAVAARASGAVLDQLRDRSSTRCRVILSPLDFFWHPGTTFYRVMTSSTVEMSTGIYGIYGQIALT